jgi:hypothetical protein
VTEETTCPGRRTRCLAKGSSVLLVEDLFPSSPVSKSEDISFKAGSAVDISSDPVSIFVRLWAKKLVSYTAESYGSDVQFLNHPRKLLPQAAKLADNPNSNVRGKASLTLTWRISTDRYHQALLLAGSWSVGIEREAHVDHSFPLGGIGLVQGGP